MINEDKKKGQQCFLLIVSTLLLINLWVFAEKRSSRYLSVNNLQPGMAPKHYLPSLPWQIIMETHESWQHLVEGKSDAGGLNTSCVTVPNASSKLTQSEAEEVVSKAPETGTGQPIDPKGKLSGARTFFYCQSCFSILVLFSLFYHPTAVPLLFSCFSPSHCGVVGCQPHKSPPLLPTALMEWVRQVYIN